MCLHKSNISTSMIQKLLLPIPIISEQFSPLRDETVLKVILESLFQKVGYLCMSCYIKSFLQRYKRSKEHVSLPLFTASMAVRRVDGWVLGDTLKVFMWGKGIGLCLWPKACLTQMLSIPQSSTSTCTEPHPGCWCYPFHS